MDPRSIDPLKLLQPFRKPVGMSAVLLPFAENGDVDWSAFCAHVARTANAGLIPAVNMDTGYGNLLDDATRRLVLKETSSTLGKRDFVAGAFVSDQPGAVYSLDAYRRQLGMIQEHAATPVVCQSFGLTALSPQRLLEAYREIARHCPRFIAFELGAAFAPFGKIYDLETYAGLLEIPQCVGAKHSSLQRMPEWQRLALRNERRPDFMVLTGNDLGIDMIMYGSDYLLGLSTFAPDLFAKRDALWGKHDPGFYELNDLLQYLGFFAFRPPVPAYKHSAAQFLKLRGCIGCDATHRASPRRPESDREVLREIWERLFAACGAA
jgi:dihydrodipicolinate synthase/N-acetylneuraminate lyase